MFSGIVEETAQVVAIEHDQDNIHITMKCSFVNELKIDQSVAHNGVCLTVVRKEGDTFTTTAMRETLERSNLGLLKAKYLFDGLSFLLSTLEQYSTATLSSLLP